MLFGGITDIAAYLSSLILVLMIVVAAFVVVVMPEFRNLYWSFGQPLPTLTRNLLERWWTAAAILVLFLLGAGLIWVGARRVRRRMLDLRPLGRGTRGLPFIGKLVGEYDRFLWMQYLAVFLDSAVPARVAGDIARTYVSAPSGSAETELVLAGAEKLGVLRETIAAQLPERRETVLRNLALIRNVGTYVVRLLIYILVGMFVTAMYLPIFGLGALV
jgi:type II secretory pathway component PulF